MKIEQKLSYIGDAEEEELSDYHQSRIKANNELFYTKLSTIEKTLQDKNISIKFSEDKTAINGILYINFREYLYCYGNR